MLGLQSANAQATPEIASNLSTSLDSLKELVRTAEKIKDELSSSVRDAVSSLSNSGSHALGVAAGNKAQSAPPDRRSNILLFGLPERDNLADTKSIVDEVFSFVVGKNVNWSAAFRLGHRKPNTTSDQIPPRPLLVKLVSEVGQ